MKKLIAVFAFFTISLLSTDSAFAQDINKINDIAKENTHTLSKELGLNDEQQTGLYRAYMLKERRMAALKNTNTKTGMDKEAIINEFYGKVQEFLTETQFQKFKAITEKKK